MIFLENRIGSVIERRLVDNNVGCSCCGRQVSPTNDIENYTNFKILNYRTLVKKFYSTISIRRVKAKYKSKIISGLIFENLETGELLPCVFPHRYFLGAFKYSKKQDNSEFDFEFGFMQSIIKTIDEEHKDSFMSNLFLDASIRISGQFPSNIVLRKKALKTFPIKTNLDFEEYYRSKGGEDVKFEIEPLSPENLKLFMEEDLKQEFKSQILEAMNYAILNWTKNWVDTTHGKIARDCLHCQVEKSVKSGRFTYWSKNKMQDLTEFNNMDATSKRNKIVRKFFTDKT